MDLFQAEMDTVTPLSDRERIRPLRTPSPRSGQTIPSKTLAIHREGHRVEGRSPGVSDEQMRALRLGTMSPEAELDLHGMRAKAARSYTTQFISNAVSRGLRFVLIIHGRGLHSGDAGPVLRDIVVDCLASPTLAKQIRGFCPATQKDGGEGAMYVALVKQ